MNITPRKLFACLTVMCLAGFTTAPTLADSAQLADTYFKQAVNQLQKAEQRSESVRDDLPQPIENEGRRSAMYTELARLQHALSTRYKEAAAEKEAVCRQADSASGQNAAVLQTSIRGAVGRLKTQSDAVQEVEQLHNQQLSLVKKIRLAVPLDQARKLLAIADVDDLIDDAARLLEKARATGEAGLPSSVEDLAKEQGIDLARINKTLEDAKRFKSNAKAQEAWDKDVAKQLAAENQRVVQSKNLLAEGLVCLARLKTALKDTEAKSAAAALAVASVSNAPPATVPSPAAQGEKKWFVYCTNQSAVARYLKDMPHSTPLGIGVFGSQPEAQAFADDSNARRVCEPSPAVCPSGTAQVPVLTNQTSAAAVSLISSRGLLPGSVQESLSYSVPKGQVISQTPYADSCVVPLTVINFVISSGADMPATTAADVMTSLIIQPASVELRVGETQRFDAVATFSGQRTDVVTHLANWSGGNGSAFTARTPGVYPLTATVNGVTRSATIVVRDYRLTALSLSPASATIKVGQTISLGLSANYEHTRFDDVTGAASWPQGGPSFSGKTPGTYDVVAQFGGKTASARITVVDNTLTPGPTPDKDDLAGQMMNDPTRSGQSGSSSSAMPGVNSDFDGFSAVPVRPDNGNSISTSSDWDGIDLDHQAQANSNARRRRNDSLHNASQQQDRDSRQRWDGRTAANLDDQQNQTALAQQGLQGSQARGQAASDTMMDALSQQQQQQDAFRARMDAQEQAAAQSAKPAVATGPPSGGAGDSGGLTSVTVSQRAIDIKIWDHGIIDGDIIILKINGIEVTDKVTLKGPGEPFVYHANLAQQTNRIEVFAVNEGTSSPNTASVSTSHVTQGKAQQKYSINQKENASYGITVSL